MKNKIYKIWAVIALAFSLSGCDKFLNVEPTDSLSGNNFWKTIDDAEAFTLESYRLFRTAYLLNTPYFIMGETRNAPVSRTNSYPYRWDIDAAARGDVRYLAYTARVAQGTSADYFWTYNVEWDELDDWTPMFQVIQSANILYENIVRLAENNATVSEAMVKKYQAEAVFMRCLTYFFMIRLYGDVPYYTNAYNREALSRTNHVEVAKNCIADLEAVKDDLPWTYSDPANRGPRAMRGSAIHLMMNLYMWIAGFDEPNKVAYYEKVDQLGDELTQGGEIEAGAYELLPSSEYDEVFRGRTREGFFEIPNSVNYQGYVGANSRKMIPFYMLDGYTVSLNADKENAEMAYYPTYMTKLFGNGDVQDDRWSLWLREDSWLSGSGQFRCYKFINFEHVEGNRAENYANSIIVMRYADALLLQAEACAELAMDDKAASLLNRIRARANTTLYPGNGYDSLKEAIYWERCKELLGEGSYYFDLVRTGKIYNSNYAFNAMTYSDFMNGAWTWPIDPKATTNNPLMRLNDFWN